MRLLLFYASLTLLCLVHCKNSNIKSLTESMGQEVIEIAGPKELPTGVEEEPSGENEDEDFKTTSFKKDFKKISTAAINKKPLKDYEKIDGTTVDDEEVRLEKELAEIYKDPEYKDSSEVTNIATDSIKNKNLEDNQNIDKPIARSRDGFKFAPDTTDKKAIERFRTSVDDINCNDRSKLKHETTTTTTTTTTTEERNSATKSNVVIHLLLNVILVKFMCI